MKSEQETIDDAAKVIAKGMLIFAVLKDYYQHETWCPHILAIGLLLGAIPGSIFSWVAPDYFADTAGGALIQMGGAFLLMAGALWATRVKRGLEYIHQMMQDTKEKCNV
jgi:hypothetical protein